MAGAASQSDLPPAPAPRPVEVAAYYFPNYHPDPRNDVWYGPGWTEWELVKSARPRFPGHRQPILPTWGYFDESDPAWAASEIDLAVSHGVTTFLYDWYWYDGAPYLQDALERGFLGTAENARLKFALMWANHDWMDIQPASLAEAPRMLSKGAVDDAAFDRLTDYVVERYLTRPNYLTLDERPYFSIYDLGTFVSGFADVAEARRALTRFVDKARDAGRPGLHLNGIVWGPATAPAGGGQPSTVALAVALGLDSVATYTWFHHHEPRLETFPRGLYGRALDFYGAWCDRSTRFPLPYHPNVTMGWDPTPRTDQTEKLEARGYPWTNVLEGNTPEVFADGLRRAEAYIERTRQAPRPGQGEQRLVTLNAWNEWTEGSYLLPDATHGTRFLEQVRAVFGA